MNYNNLLDNYQLEFQETVSEKFMCSLCRKILRNPHTVPCGHSYCFTCIKNHIKNENTFCVGKDSECYIEPLDLSKNVSKDFRVNKKINKLKVKCVNENCSDFVEIKNLELHMERCTCNIYTCPFEIVGCTVKGLNKNDIKDHLVQSSLDHATTMTKYIEELKNKNDELILKIDHMQRQFEQLENEISQNTTNIESKILEENRCLKSEIMEEVDYKIMLERASTKQECESKIMYEKWEIENQMTTKVEQLENKMTTEKEQLYNKIMNETTNLELKIMEEIENKMKTEKEELEKKLNFVMEELNKLSDQIKEGNDKKIKRMNIGENYVAVDKEVKVTFDKMSRKKKDEIYMSDLFILERYSFKLGICHKSNDLVTFSMYLVKGQYDKKVSWPMKRTIQMNILNRDGNLYNCHEFNYETRIKAWKNQYNKPEEDEVINDSHVATFYDRILINNTATVIVKMID